MSRDDLLPFRSSPRGMRIWAVVGLTFSTGPACSPAEHLSVDRAVSQITAEGIRRHVAILAHDSMRGRDTDDIGFERARDYVEREFRRIGLQPIEGDSYLQPFGLQEVSSDQGSRLLVGAAVLEFPDVIATPDWSGGQPTITGEGVYMGHGLVTGTVFTDGGAPLTGRIAFVLDGVPDGRGEDPDIAMRKRAEVELALRAGAVGVVVLNPNGSDAAWDRQARPRRPTRVLADGTSPTPRPLARVSPAASRRLLETWDVEGDGLEIGSVTIERRHRTRMVRSWNLIGVWPGSDPELADEAVVFTAHLDHVGIGPPDATGDSIYNGTHDNALGVAKVLAVAEALRGTRLRRSVVFLLTGAEESGLLGAWHYVNNPVVALESTVAAINHDGGLVDVRTDDVFAWGPEFSTVEADVEHAALETGLVLSRDKRPPFGPSAGLLYRSDHYPFLISGVPVVYLMPGFTIEGDPEAGRRAWQDYLATIHHAQADDFEGSAPYASPLALTAMSLRLAWQLADADGMPRTHDDAPIRRTRGAPNGFFFGDPPPIARE